VLCGAATRELGIPPLLHAIADLLPSAADRSAAFTSAAGEVIAPDPDAPFTAQVIKTSIDRYTGTLSIFRVVSGRCAPTRRSSTRRARARSGSGKLFLMRGGEHVEVPEAGPATSWRWPSSSTSTPATRSRPRKGGIALAPMTIPQGVISYAIRAKSKGDEDKVFSSLGRLVEEDPTLQLGRDPATGEYLLTGRGELHVRMTVHKLHRMFGVDVELRTPKVPYRETVRRRPRTSRASSRSRAAARECSESATSRSSLCPAERASSSPTRSSAARSRAT
jgi:elongation factor G